MSAPVTEAYAELRDLVESPLLGHSYVLEDILLGVVSAYTVGEPETPEEAEGERQALVSDIIRTLTGRMDWT